MRIRDGVSRRAALGLAVAALGAGLLSGSGRAPARADMYAPAPGISVRQRDHVPAPQNQVPVSEKIAESPQRSATSVSDPATEAAQAAVRAAVAKELADRPDASVSIAALDTATGIRVTWQANTPMTAASLFKLVLLEGYLLQNQDDGQSPGDGESDALAAMIENSDNDAADQVYEALGGAAGVGATLPRLGLAGTVLGSDDHWGLSTTTAADQLTLLGDLVTPTSPLSVPSRAYALQLMRNVEDDQRWGVGAADPSSAFANKNGWLEADDDGRWAVNSVGVIDGRRVLLAVLSQHDANFTDGIDLVESLSDAVSGALSDANAETVAGPATAPQPQR
jgi:beta-lactamase class A